MDTSKIEYPKLKDIPITAWEKLSNKKIYFGHQSVGNNIIEGIKEIIKTNSHIEINIIETSHPEDFQGGGFAHSRIGENGKPISKIDDFASKIENGIGNKADIAFFKLCFADIIGTTNVESVFASYKNTMARLEKEFPEIKIVHVTVPLLSDRKTFKTWIKSKIGKMDNWGYHGNLRRNELNEMLRKEYKGRYPFLDLAMIEATFSDGKIASFSENGKTYYYLIPEYTHDGGHLNQTGRRIVAEQFLVFLAGL